MDLIDLIIVFAAGYFIGKMHAYYILGTAIRDAAEEAGIDLEKELNLKPKEPAVAEVHKLKVEVINDVLYLYDKDNHDFICQGKNMDELATLCKEHKKILLASVLYGENIFMFVNGISKEFKE